MMGTHYSIQLASKISGVGIHTIRAWEKRYQAVSPTRSDNGRREYSDADIERLSLLLELCTVGHSIGKIAGSSTEDLKKLLKKLGKRSALNNAFSLKKNEGTLLNVSQSLATLLLALSAYKLDVISHEITKISLLLSPRQLALEIISPLLREVGLRVERRELTISQEHALSAILKFHVGHLLFKNVQSKSSKPYKILIGTVEGDFHEFGILQAALLCNHYGLNYYYLGPNLPAEALIDTCKSLEADIVIVGATVHPEGKESGFIEKYIERTSKVIHQKGHLIFGGAVKINRDRIKKLKRVVIFDQMTELDYFLKNL
jgi:DNA-binding transcriptional MerR regulator